jgi:hypothetical protein
MIDDRGDRITMPLIKSSAPCGQLSNRTTLAAASASAVVSFAPHSERKSAERVKSGLR